MKNSLLITLNPMIRRTAWRKNKNLVVLFVLIFVFCGLSLLSGTANASTGVSPDVSFEGKIVNSSGVNITNGTYNVEFTMYTGCTNEPTNNTGCTLAWTEDYLTSATQGVAINGGTFAVNLGQYCTFAGSTCQGNTNTGINWNTYPIYMSMQIGGTANCSSSPAGGLFTANCAGDGVMQPYILMTSTPYAQNAGTLGNIAASGFAQLAIGSQTFTGSNTFEDSTNSTTAFQVDNNGPHSILDVDTSANQVVFGNTTTNLGQVVFDDGTNSNAVTINAGSGTAAYSLTLPTVAPTTSECIRSGASTAGLLVFGSCGSGSGINNGFTLQSSASFDIQSASGHVTGVLEANGADTLDLQNSSAITVESFGSTGAALFENSTNSTTAFQVQTSAAANVLNVNTTNSIVDVGALSAPGTLTATQAPIAGSLTGTAGSTTYTYYITAVSANGSESLASSETSSLLANNITTHNITVNWTTNGAAYYKIYRQVSGGTPSSLGLVGTSTTSSFVDTGYTAGAAAPALATTGSLGTGSATFYYEVTALDNTYTTGGAIGQSTPSTQLIATTNASNKSLTIDWAPVNGARAYNVYRSTTPGVYTTDSYYTVYTNSFTDTNGTATGTNVVPPTINSGYGNDLSNNASANITIGNNGTAVGQLYVGGSVPTAIGTISTGSGSTPWSDYVQGNYAYVTDNGNSTLQVIDISNPANPVIVGSVGTGSYPGQVVVQGNYAYVANYGANDLQIFNVSNPSNPVSVSSITTGSGAYSVSVQGDYAYVTADGGAGSLQIFNVSNPSVPVLVSTTTTTSGNFIQLVTVQGDYAYVAGGLANTLQIFNVSNPFEPVLTSTTAVNDAGYLDVQGRYAYIIAGNALQILDISNPANPIILSTLYNVYIAASIQGKYAYVAGYGNLLQVIDISNPSDPTVVNSVALGAGSNITSNALFVQGRYAYLANNGTSTLQIFDLGGAYVQQLQVGGTETGSLQVDSSASVSGNESVTGSISVGGSVQISSGLGVNGPLTASGTVPTSGAIGGGVLNGDNNFVVNGNYLYGVGGPSEFETYDVSNPSAPVETGSYSTSACNVTSPAAVSGSYVYEACDADVYVINVSNPSSPTLVGTIASSQGYGIAVSGNYVYVTTVSALNIYNVSNPAKPTLIGSIALNGSPTGLSINNVTVVGNYVYIVSSSPDFYIVNVTTPSNPIISSTTTAHLTSPVALSVVNGDAYISDFSGNYIAIFNVNNPASPSYITSINTGASSNPAGSSIQGQYLYVAESGTNAVSIINISNPSSPSLVGTLSGVTSYPNNVAVNGRYLYVNGYNGNSFEIYDLSGAYIQQLQAGGTETGTLQVDSNANVSGSESISGGLNVSGSEQVVGNLGAGGLNISGLATPAQPTLTVTTAGTTSYSYGLTANNGDGNSALSPTQTTALAAASLNNSTAYVEVSWPAVSGATTYNIYRTAGGSSQGSIGTVTSASTTASMTPTSGSETGTVLTLNFSSSVSWGLGQAITLAGFTMNTGSVNGTWPIVSVSGSTITINITAGVTSTISVEGTATGNSSGTIGFFDTAQTAGSAAPSVATAGTLTLATTSVNALQIENSTSASILDVDTSGNQTIFGNTTANAGQIVFDDGTNSNAVTINVGSGTANYSLTLPTIAPSTGQCLQSGAVTAGLLVFASCSASGSILDQGGNNFGATTVIGSTGAYGLNLITSNTVVNSLNSISSVVYQNASNSTAAFQLQGYNSGNGASVLLNADTTNAQVGIGSINGDNIGLAYTTPVTGLISGTDDGGTCSYTYEVMAVTYTGEQSIAETITQSSTSCTLNPYYAVLNWTQVATASTYYVYRSATTSAYGTGLISDGNGLSNAGSTEIFEDMGSAVNPIISTYVPPVLTGTLPSSTTYYYEVTALAGDPYDIAGSGESAAAYQETAVTTSFGNIALGWTAVPGAVGYRVYRTTTSGNYTTDSVFTTTSAGFSDINGTPAFTNVAPPTSNNYFYSYLGNNATGNVDVAGSTTNVDVSQLEVGGSPGNTVDTEQTVGSLTLTTGSTIHPDEVVTNGDYSYVLASSTSGVLNYFYIIDVGNPKNPEVLSTTVLQANMIGDAIEVQGNYAYIMAYQNQNVDPFFEMLIYNVSNPTSPVLVGNTAPYTSTSYLGWGGFTVQGDYAYVADDGSYNDGFQIIDISNPANPFLVNSTAVEGGNAQSLVVSGSFLYVTSYGGSSGGYFQVFNVANPHSPVLENGTGLVLPFANSEGITMKGNYVIIDDDGEPGEIIAINISNPTNPVIVSSLLTGGAAFNNLISEGNYLYASDEVNFGIYVFDITNINNITTIGSINDDGGAPCYVSVQGNYVYAANCYGPPDFVIYNAMGSFVNQLQVGGLETGALNVDNNSQINGNESIADGLVVSGNSNISGNLGVSGNLDLSGILVGGHNLGMPVATITQGGTAGVVKYSYAVAALNANGTTPATSSTQTSLGNATLTGTNFNTITWTAITGATSYNIYRTASAGTPATTGLIGNTASLTFNDTGLAATTAAPTLDSSGSLTISGYLTLNKGVLIGSSGATNTTQDLLQPNSIDTLAETATCAASTNQGALYYNYVSSTVRACIGGAWQDLVSTQGLSTLLFGVVPNSGNKPADLIGASATAVAASNTGGPCKVNYDSTTSVYVNSCMAYSGGREVSVSATAVSIAAVAASSYQNICLTAAGVPALLGSSSTTSGSQTFNTLTTTNGTTYGQPLLCLATIKTTAVAGTLSNIYDARTFTNTTKSYATIATAIDGYLGATVTPSNTAGLVVWSSSATGIIQGVVVASSGANGVAGSPNIMIATAGPQWMFGNAGTLNDFIVPTTTTGVAAGTAVAGLDANDMLGVELNTYATSCAAQTFGATDCQYSLFAYLGIQ
jgi:hypothetical protein